MDKATALIFLAFLLVGCGRRMSNEEIIKQVKICTDAGMDYQQYGWGGTEYVMCTKKWR